MKNFKSSKELENHYNDYETNSKSLRKTRSSVSSFLKNKKFEDSTKKYKKFKL